MKKSKKLGTIVIVIATLALLMSGAIGLVGCGNSDSGGSSGGAGSGGSSGGDTGGGDTDVYVEVEIAKLFADYENQVGMADELYKDQKIKIVGKVLSVQDLRMVLALPDENNQVVVIYAVTLASMSGSEGDTVEVQGVCKGMGTGTDNNLVKLTDCVVVVKVTNPG